MYAIIRTTKSQQDNSGDPEVDFEIDHDVLLFDDEKQAQRWVDQHPPNEPGHDFQEQSYYMLEPIRVTSA